MLAAIDVDGDDTSSRLAMLHRHLNAWPKIDLAQEPQQFWNIVFDFKDLSRNGDWEIGQIGGMFVLPQLTVCARDGVAVRAGLRIVQELR